METRYKKVRVKGVDLVGTLAFRGESKMKYFGTVDGRNTAIVSVYFQETGEIRHFNESFIEELADTE